MFDANTYAIIYGSQLSAAQKMLDFDFLCERSPSVVGFVIEGKTKTVHKLFFGETEIFVPAYPDFVTLPKDIVDICDTLVNFASSRSSGRVTKDAMRSGIFKNIVNIAEGVPERETREIIALNNDHKLNIVGPATVGAMTAGGFRAGNTGGSLENIIASKLYRPGSVGFVSKSGGMSNELRRVIADRTSGTKHSIALGGDRYSTMVFADAIQIMQDDPDIDMIVMLGELGGRDELQVAKMIREGIIAKPIIAWCIGTIGDEITSEIQFGHAGAKSNSEEETAAFKNKTLKKAGAIVPESYMDLGDIIEKTYKQINNSKREEKNNKEILKKLEIMKDRKKTHFSSTISDERGDELSYNKKPVSDYVAGGDFVNVIANLWLKRDLPKYASGCINTILILLADHGPAVSGAHNAIVTARAGNDLKSSLISALATIGPRFGGAIDGAAMYFSKAVADGISPKQFVTSMKSQAINIPGIGHKVKSKFNPDKRCEILLEMAKKFPNRTHLSFALEVEKITLEKKDSLILNVDGMVAVLLLDIFTDIGMSQQEIQEYIEAGIFNGFFILARSVGFIGHIIDQKRLSEPLYRTPWEDIAYE